MMRHAPSPIAHSGQVRHASRQGPTIEASPSPAFVPANWVAERFGIHPDTFRRYRPLLAKAGFPEPNPLLGRYLVEDMEAWIKNRRRIALPGECLAGDTNQEVNHDAL